MNAAPFFCGLTQLIFLEEKVVSISSLLKMNYTYDRKKWMTTILSWKK